jgi:ribosome-associated protein
VASSSKINSTGAASLPPEQLALLCAESASNKKAEEIVVLDMRGLSGIADFFVICSGTSEPHLKAIAGEIQERRREDHQMRPHNVDGYPMSQWIVVDYYDVLVHIFHTSKRGFYSLESLWSDAPRLPLPATV